jgi:hypothetical protein
LFIANCGCGTIVAERLKSLARQTALRAAPHRQIPSSPHVSLICQSKSEHIIRDDEISDVDGRTLTPLLGFPHL